MTPTISIALCTYNGAAFLVEQLESLTRQERQPDEIVVCDDHSHDGTADIVHRFASQSPVPIRLFINPANLGTARNFNRAISLCRGEIIALCDQDDCWLPTKLSRIESEFARTPAAVGVFSDGIVVDRTLKPLKQRLWHVFALTPEKLAAFRRRAGSEVLLKHHMITGATMAFLSAYRSWVLPIPPNWHHDAWIGLVFAFGGEWAPIEEPLILYRQHAANQIGGVLNARTRWIAPLKINRRAFLAAEIDRFLQLYRRLRQLNLASPEQLAALVGKLEHLLRLRQLPTARLRRIRPIWHELAQGGYDRFARTRLTAIKDCIL
ncbi:MAG: glycosyltransferase family 2 protein [Desulfobacterales bacterium]|jgi:glycosyltransferase involved in cell wall biosynthesis|nr:glycosyltransferase family 2 protein [Desulfobacterales bacterium]